MKKIKLTAEEKTLMASIENEEFSPLSGKELKDIADAIVARKKDAILTIRVNSGDIRRIKKLASKRGIPYQSYISEVIHRTAQAI